MTRGRAIVGPAAIVAFVFFFLPWVTSSCQGQEVVTLSGRELASGTTVQIRPLPQAPLSQPQHINAQPRLWAIPLAAALCLLLVVLVALRVMRPPLAGLLAAVLAIICLLILLDRTLEIRRQADQNGFDVHLRYGAIGAALAYVAVLFGAILDIFTGWAPRVAPAGPPGQRELPP